MIVQLMAEPAAKIAPCHVAKAIIQAGGHGFTQGVAHRIELNQEINSTLKEMGYETNGHPPYEYNGQTYDNKGSLYGAILVGQFAEQFGIKDIVALAAVLDGTFPSIDKPFTTLGSSSKTSYAPKYESKILPQKMPTKLPTHINPNTGKMAYTKVLGRF